LVIEFSKNQIPFEREKLYNIEYKGVILPHYYVADFVVYDNIVMEVKAVECLTESHIKQSLNYLAASSLKLALLINFGESSLKHKRIIL
jgi:GxxExxY protein